MRIHRVIRARLRERVRGIDVDGDLNAVVAVNVDERSSTRTGRRRAGRREEPPPGPGSPPTAAS